MSNSFFNPAGYAIFWVLFAIALGLLGQRILFLVRLLKLGRPDQRFDHMFRRLFSMLKVAFSQSSNLKTTTLKDPAAIGHAVMFWGLLVFGLAYFIFIGLGVGFGLFRVLGGSPFEVVFYSILDIVALLVLLSVVYVVIKRYIIRPDRLERPQHREEKIVQALLLTIITLLMLLHFGIEGFGYAWNGIPGDWPPVGAALANALADSNISYQTVGVVYHTLWWVNYGLLLCAVIYAPRSKHLHPLTSFFNLTFRNLEPKGRLKLLDLSQPKASGVSRIEDFSWKHILDLYACTWCGKCHEVCPANLSGKSLSPREMVLGLREHLMAQAPALLKAGAGSGAVSSITAEAVGLSLEISGKKQPDNKDHVGQVRSNNPALIDNVISQDAIWSCTTCRACQEVCPVSIEHVDKIVDFRRHLQMVATTEVARDSLKNIRVRGNPWRGTTYARTDWAEGLNIREVSADGNIDILFWVGCTGALEDRSLKVTQAVAALMKEAGTNFGILGEEEMCCGDPARRLGAEHIFQMLATNNIQLLQSYKVKKIVTACPHCFNTLKNEYPQLGGQFEVVHHTQFIAELIRNHKLKIRPSLSASVTYQEPCYLGRYNDIFEDPRQILKDIPGLNLVEMKENRKNAFCCGGGGGRMWLEEKSGQRISEMRLNQALETQAQVVATACPFCLQMLEDAAKAKEVDGSLKIKDIAEILVEASQSEFRK
jgi:Fe-S oxidoreductase